MTVEKLKSYEPFFGSWTVEGKLAEGRYSKVFKVGRIVDGNVRHQCLKTIRFPSGNEELSKVISSGIYTNVQEYLDEVELSVRTNMDKMLTLRDSRNIVRFDNYTIIKESSCFYLVILMELLKPLGDYLRVDSATQNEVIRIGTDLCCALSDFRQADIIHHEIKPENIYVDKNGNFKLGDFGVCKGRFGEDRVTSSYIAPELYSNGAIDLNSDIYSLGILIYKLLNNNRLPFLPSYPAPVSASDRESAFTRRMRGDLFPAPSNATTPLAHVIYKATAFRATDRFSTPEELSAELERNLNFVPPEATAAAYIPPVPVTPLAPSAPVNQNPYNLTDNSQVPLYDNRPHIHNEVSYDEINDYEQAFSEDGLEDVQEGEQVNKKWYFIIIGLVVVLAVVIGLVAKGGSDKNKTTQSTTTVVFGETASPAQSTSVGVSYSSSAASQQDSSAASTTSVDDPVTVGSTTMAGTGLATIPASTEPSTSETPTTEPSATTAPSTTEEQTTTEPTTAAYTEPNFIDNNNTQEGGSDTYGKTYTTVSLSVVASFGDGKDAIIKMEGLGDTVEPTTNDNCITIYTMDNAALVRRSAATATLTPGSDGSISCFITAEDDSFSFEPDTYQYFIAFESGAVSTENQTNLGIQIRVE